MVLKPMERKGLKKENLLNSSNVLPHHGLWGLYPYSNVTSEESKAQNGCWLSGYTYQYAAQTKGEPAVI